MIMVKFQKMNIKTGYLKMITEIMTTRKTQGQQLKKK